MLVPPMVSFFLDRTELRRCIGSAFRVFGSRQMLSFPSLSLNQLTTLPLTSLEFSHDSNSWVLPLMSEFVERDELQFFESHLLSLARDLFSKGSSVGEGELKFIESRHYRRLVSYVVTEHRTQFLFPTNVCVDDTPFFHDIASDWIVTDSGS